MRFNTNAVLSAIALGLVATRAVDGQAAPAQFPPFQAFVPGNCAVTPVMIEHFVERANPDTTAYTPAKDVRVALVADSARICRSGVEAGTIDDIELLNFARVQLIEGLDAEAKATAQRYLSLPSTSTPERRAWALYMIVSDNAVARPARIATAREVLTQLDALGNAALKPRHLAHYAMARAAMRHWDDATVKSESDAAIAVWKLLPRERGLRLAGSLAGAFLMKGEIALRTKGGDAARAVIDTALMVVPEDAGLPRLAVVARARMYAVVDKPAPTITAKFWFRAPSVEGSRPAKGKVSIVSTAEHYCDLECIPRFQGLARYDSRFASRGLELINVTKTYGFYGDSAPKPPIEEARHDSAHFLDKVKLPGSLAVHESEPYWLRDGRRRNRLSPQEFRYASATFVIVDKKGIIRYLAPNWEPMLEEPLAKFIEKLLAES
jgi:hypothetical protein